MFEEKKEKKPFFASSTCFNINICNAWKLALDLNKFFQTKRQDNLHFILHWKASKQQPTSSSYTIFFTLPVVQWVTKWGWWGDFTSHYSNVRFTAPIIRFDIIWWRSSWVILTYFPPNGQRPSCVPFCDLRSKSNVEKRKKKSRVEWSSFVYSLVVWGKNHTLLFFISESHFFFHD